MSIEIKVSKIHFKRTFKDGKTEETFLDYKDIVQQLKDRYNKRDERGYISGKGASKDNYR